MDLSKPLDEMKEAADGAAAASIAVGLDNSSVDVVTTVSPLFEEFYDDWASFDAAVARATAAHHPIRKRSSLTFEVYNRTVSKGRHDRQNIAEFLSKTFKCTHGIKFRSRGNGKRMRHKLRDIGCPFHVYASAVEFGATYRVKVRVHEQHNHPIGPDSMKAMSGALHESDYELAVENDGQTQVEEAVPSEHTVPPPAKFEETMTLESLRKRIANFAEERDWNQVCHRVRRNALASHGCVANCSVQPNQFHTPRNLLLALTGEVGELCEIFQWKGECKTVTGTLRRLLDGWLLEFNVVCFGLWVDWSARDKEHLGEELSDVLIYLVRLADKCDVDLPAALNDKITKNGIKYPADLVRNVLTSLAETSSPLALWLFGVASLTPCSVLL
ncbi:hypothetical protein BBJ28_00004968 [Nothophytophthora sp. Chile5]|nr:hypothetical protein BBJ28_00004968 [Nothophytophthora sp. Chile5]